jgi:hypothetical protein
MLCYTYFICFQSDCRKTLILVKVMLKKSIAGALLIASCNVFAVCPGLNGNWVIQNSAKPSDLDALGLIFDSSTSRITISNGTITLRSGFAIGLTNTGIAAFATPLEFNGVITLNKATCRIRFKGQGTSSVSVSNGQTSNQVIGSAQSAGSANYSNILRGWAGKATAISLDTGQVLHSTFTMTRD